MKNFDVGKQIKTIIDNSENAAIEPLKGKAFPLVSPVNTTFPFCVYRRTSYTPINSKDYTDEAANVEIIIVNDTYGTAIETANALTGEFLNTSTDTIDEVKLLNASEDYFEGCYLEVLNFEFTYK